MGIVLRKQEIFGDARLPLEVIGRDPQPPFPLHAHDVTELVIITRGTGTHFTENAEYLVSTGDVFVIHGDLRHGYRDLHDLALVNILYDEKALSLNLYDLRALPGFHALFYVEPKFRRQHEFKSSLHLNQQQLAPVCDLTDKIETEIRKRQPGCTFMAVSHFMNLLGVLSRFYVVGKLPEQRHVLRMAETISYLETNWRKEIALADLTAISHMSESTLLRAFRKATGASPIEYVLRLRVRKACELLQKTDLTVSEIAGETGFADSNYFTRQFRKIVGLPPRDYRNRETGKA
jgi:AraC-like DNA-binding protein